MNFHFDAHSTEETSFIDHFQKDEQILVSERSFLLIFSIAIICKAKCDVGCIVIYFLYNLFHGLDFVMYDMVCEVTQF